MSGGCPSSAPSTATAPTGPDDGSASNSRTSSSLSSSSSSSWEKYDQAELDRQMSPSQWSTRLGPDAIISSHIETTLSATRAAQDSTAGGDTNTINSAKKLRVRLAVRYGKEEEEVMDIYEPPLLLSSEHAAAAATATACATLPAPPISVVVVYIHGGMWQALGREHAGFGAISVCAGVTGDQAAAAFVAIDHTLAPKADLSTIVAQCARAIHHTSTLFPSARIVLAGHSAGAHLAAMMLLPDVWHDISGETATASTTTTTTTTPPPAAAAAATTPVATASALAVRERISAIALVSGLFDLAPVARCYANEALQLTPDQVERLSPLRRADELATVITSGGVRVLFAMAEHDPQEFRRHSLDMAHKLTLRGVVLASSSGCSASGNGSSSSSSNSGGGVVDVAGHDHFDVVERLADPGYDLTKQLIALCKEVA